MPSKTLPTACLCKQTPLKVHCEALEAQRKRLTHVCVSFCRPSFRSCRHDHLSFTPARCHERRAERADGFPGGLGATAGRRGHGLQGLGAAQLPGAGELQPPLCAGAVLEEALPEPGQAEGLQSDLRAAFWLCDGQLYPLFFFSSVLFFQTCCSATQPHKELSGGFFTLHLIKRYFFKFDFFQYHENASKET